MVASLVFLQPVLVFFIQYFGALVQWQFGMADKDSNTLWIWVLPHACWGVWKERNNRIFRDKESNAKVVFHKCFNALLEDYTYAKGPIPPLNTMVKDKREGCS